MKRFLYVVAIGLIVGIVLSSCRTQYIPVETVKTEYKVRDSILRDSIYQRDSVYMLVKGDTVYMYKYKYLYKYRYINKTDTLMKTDSIQIPYPVEKRLSRWQQFKMDFGGTAMLAIVVLVFIVVGVWMRKLKV